MNLPSSHLEVVCKTAVQTILQSSQKNTCAGVLFEYFLRLKGCKFIIKEVRLRSCPVALAKHFQKGYTTPMCDCIWSLCYTGHSNKNFKQRVFVLCLLYQYGYWIKIGKSRNYIKRKEGLYQKYCIRKKGLYKQKFLIYHDIMDIAAPFFP